MHRIISVLVLVLFVLPMQTVYVYAAENEAVSSQIQLDWASPGVPGTISGPAARAMLHGPLQHNPAMITERKALAPTGEAAQAAPAPLAASPTPVLLLGKNGIIDNTGTPSDSTGAKGTTRYIEVVNSRVGIYTANLGLIAQDTLENWWQLAGASAFDPQVMWDSTTSRFYYVGDAVFSNADNRIAFGFSKTNSPNNTVGDWCHYQVSYGANFPDYPKLGDSSFFIVVGVNTFGPTSFIGSDIVAISKPPAGSTCPGIGSFKIGTASNIKIGQTQYFTPVPAIGIDGNGNSWVVAIADVLPATTIGLFKVTKDATTGDPIMPTTGVAMTVPAYDAPLNAPQKDSTFLIDTLDGRMTQAVAAIDPAHSSKFAIWTQHTIKGGAGAMVRWYEIDPVGHALLQSGNVTNASLYYFNSAISPDRVVKGATKAFGQNMVINFNASSPTTYPSIRMVSKRGADSISPVKLVKTSPGPDLDFSCSSGTPCRWGDYSAASPDPSADITGATGIVWGTNMWTANGSLAPGNIVWRTWNYKAQP